MIKLLYVITKLELGGAQKHLLSLIKHLDKDRFRVFLFTAKDGLLVPEASHIKGLILKKSKYLERPINPLKDLCALVEIYRFIKINDIGIVHTHSSKAGILGRLGARLAGVNFIIHTVHGWSFNDCQPRMIRSFIIWLERRIARFTDRLIAVSDYDRAKGLGNHIGDEDKYALIRYGIDYEEFGAGDRSLRKELGLKDTDFAVATVACLKPQKYPQDFIKLASVIKKAFPEVKFILVGDGILRKEIERLINKFGLQEQVILLGWRRDVPKILQAIDVFVLTSLWEGLPISVLEAMLSCKPVISTNTGGVAEIIVEKETGFLVAPGDVQTMAKDLACLLEDAGLKNRIGNRAKDSLGTGYRLEKMVENTDRLYRDLILNG